MSKKRKGLRPHTRVRFRIVMIPLICMSLGRTPCAVFFRGRSGLWDKLGTNLGQNGRFEGVYWYCRETRTALYHLFRRPVLYSCVGGVRLTLRGFHPPLFLGGRGSHTDRGPRQRMGKHRTNAKHLAERQGAFLFGRSGDTTTPPPPFGGPPPLARGGEGLCG